MAGEDVAIRDSIAYINIGGVDYAAREFKYSASVLKIADAGYAVLPAPDGKVRAVNGEQVPISEVAPMGARIKLSISDALSNGGARIDKLVGVVTGRRMSADPGSGTTLQIDFADLGFCLSTCARVFSTANGMTWKAFAEKNIGIPGNKFGFGFAGFRADNSLNRRLKAGRAGVQWRLQQEQTATLEIPPFSYFEVGQTLDQFIIQRAKFDRFLVNVSADGWLQLFRPADKEPARYVFHHHPAGSSDVKKNNVIQPMVEESADSLYTKVEVWSTVVDPVILSDAQASQTLGAGRYHGTFDSSGTLPFERRFTTTDTEQMSQARATARARWQWQRFSFDSFTYSFYAVGHSQGGVPFVEDTVAELHDSVFGLDGLFYVAAVDCERKLAAPGVSRGAGTRARITLKRPGLLGA